MRLRHWLMLALVIVGGLFVWHMVAAHQGFAGFKSGLGLS